ncbi:outer membrane beta-barrel protein [Photobacterium leiognathi]|uniref:outer membrane beta-barrel protein n=1 Tax=Photobacterium leiognathi TaxID=553611 RepID=UPI0027395203|nr:outer membrane beta-barrel protein [Photobacterium leiognathi]
MKRVILTTLSYLLLSSFAFASEDMAMNKYKGFYIGAGIGTTNYNIKDVGELSDDELTGYSSESDGMSYKIFTGYQFNRIIALEAEYTKYGNLKHTFEFDDEDFTVKTKRNSFSLATNIGYTFDNGLRPFSIIGISKVFDKHSSKDELNFKFKEKGGSVRLGAGLDYQFAGVRGLGLRTAYEVDLYSDSRVGSWIMGVTYKL